VLAGVRMLMVRQGLLLWTDSANKALLDNLKGNNVIPLSSQLIISGCFLLFLVPQFVMLKNTASKEVGV
jgi:hypothetical protein